MFTEGFFNIKIDNSGSPEITTLVLKHDKSIFDFSFNEESDGNEIKNKFDIQKNDYIYVADLIYKNNKLYLSNIRTEQEFIYENQLMDCVWLYCIYSIAHIAIQ